MPGLAEVDTLEVSNRQNRYADSLAEALRIGTVLVVGPVTGSELNRLLEQIEDDERIQRITVPEVFKILSDQEHRWNSNFDAVVCEAWDDILDVKDLLPALRQSLKPSGKLFLQIQNTRHQSVVNQLLKGSWRQNGSRRTARRFYTKNEIEKLLFRGGFEIAGIQPETDEEMPSFSADETSTFSLIGRLQVGTLKGCDLEDFYSKKYSIVATKQPQQLRPLTSIVILTHNQVAYTRMCIHSIRRFTDEPCELIVVDNASTDSTVSYLQSLGDVTSIFNQTNRGFPAALNQGMEVAKGEYVLLLNNDTIVTAGWLRRMQQAMQSDSQVGLVGPVSNNVSGRQQVLCELDDLAFLDGFAWERGKTHAERLRDSDRLVGFCLLIKKELIEQIGNLDERFGIGCFEDDDFCRRAIHAGYRAVIADDSFVYHFGSITFRNSTVDFAELMSENQQKYDQKWKDESTDTNKKLENGSQSDWKVKTSGTGGLLLEKQTCKLSLCMIVRDNENTIEPCLKSIQPWVDEIIVVDTGSLDRTPDICKQYGAKL